MATAHPAIAAHAQTVTAAIALNAWAASPLMVSLSIPTAPLSPPPRGGLPCKPLPAMAAWSRLSPSRAACKPPPVSALQRPSCGHRAPCTAPPCLCGRHPRCCWRGTPHSIPLAARPGSCRGLGSPPCTTSPKYPSGSFMRMPSGMTLTSPSRSFTSSDAAKSNIAPWRSGWFHQPSSLIVAIGAGISACCSLASSC